MAICCGLAASSIGICSNSVGVFFAPVSVQLGVGRGVFALHATISNLIAGLFCPIGMKLIKKYNYRAVISLGIIMAGGANILMSMGGNVWVFYILGAIRGIGCSFFALPTITSIISNWFEEKQGFAMGLTLCFSGLSGAIFSPLFNYLIILLGWRYTFVIIGILVIVLALPGALFVLNLNPEEKNLLPYGAKEKKAPVTVLKDMPKSKTKLLSAPFMMIAVFAFLSSSICGIAQNFPGYTQSIGSTATLGATMISAAMVGNIVFKLLIGIMSDKIGPIKSSGILGLANIASLILLNRVNPSQNYAVTLAIAFIYGAIYAIGAVGVPLITRYIFGTENYSSVYSYIFIFTSIGSASSLTIVGLLYDYFKTYQIGIIGGIVIGFVNLILLYILNRIKDSQEKTNGKRRECA